MSIFLVIVSLRVICGIKHPLTNRIFISYTDILILFKLFPTNPVNPIPNPFTIKFKIVLTLHLVPLTLNLRILP